MQFGLRWDDQTYTGLPSGAQLSPRISVLHALNPKTELRFSWGRYYQSQGIHELQIEDDLTRFFPAQRAITLLPELATDSIPLTCSGSRSSRRT